MTLFNYLINNKVIILKIKMDLSQLQKYNNSLEDSLYYDNQGITEIDIKNVCEYYPEKLYNFDQNSKKLEDVEKTFYHLFTILN